MSSLKPIIIELKKTQFIFFYRIHIFEIDEKQRVADFSFQKYFRMAVFLNTTNTTRESLVNRQLFSIISLNSET